MGKDAQPAKTVKQIDGEVFGKAMMEISHRDRAKLKRAQGAHASAKKVWGKLHEARERFEAAWKGLTAKEMALVNYSLFGPGDVTISKAEIESGSAFTDLGA